MSKAYQFPDDPQRPNPFADNTPPTAGGSDNPYAAPQAVPEQGGGFGGQYYQTTPHRGGLLLALGILGLLGVLLSMAFVCCAPITIVLAAVNFGLTIPAWLMGRNDLKAIAAGAIDPSGRGSTQAGFILGLCGTIGNVLAIVAAVAWLAVIIWSD